MTRTEAFKLGFLEYMADRGMDPDVLDDLLVKRADGLTGALAGAAKGMGSIGAQGLKGMGLLGAAGAKGLLFGVPATAAVGGWFLGSQDKVTKADLRAMEEMALINEYQDALKQMHDEDRSERKIKNRPVAGQTSESVLEPADLPKDNTIPFPSIPKAAAVAPAKLEVAPSPLAPKGVIEQNIERAKNKIKNPQLAPVANPAQTGGQPVTSPVVR